MISGRTKLYGIFGFPVEHSFSPAMQNAAFQALHMDCCYVPFAVHPADLRKAMKALHPLGIQGLNITIPHKVRVLSALDQLSDEARLIGAVNTVQISKGRTIGHNTDGRGFLRSLREEGGFDPRKKIFLCAGAGGAARAVCFSLALAGASKILFFNRDLRKADRLARDIRTGTGVHAGTLSTGSLAAAARSAHCLINATSLGLGKNDPLPLPADLIGRDHLVCDLVYNPRNTLFLRTAARKRARTLSGIGMLLYQGVIAFEIWTGRRAPVEVMRKALLLQVGK